MSENKIEFKNSMLQACYNLMCNSQYCVLPSTYGGSYRVCKKNSPNDPAFMVGHTVLFVYYLTEGSKSKSRFEASEKDTYQNESFSEIPILYSEAEKMWKKVNEAAFDPALQSLKDRAKSSNR